MIKWGLSQEYRVDLSLKYQTMQFTELTTKKKMTYLNKGRKKHLTKCNSHLQ